jgi:hypothetical protein
LGKLEARFYKIFGADRECIRRQANRRITLVAQRFTKRHFRIDHDILGASNGLPHPMTWKRTCGWRWLPVSYLRIMTAALFMLFANDPVQTTVGSDNLRALPVRRQFPATSELGQPACDTSRRRSRPRGQRLGEYHH